MAKVNISIFQSDNSTAWPDLHDEVGVGESLTLVADSVVDQTKAEVESHREHDGSPVDDCPRLRLNSQLGRDNFDTDTDCPFLSVVIRVELNNLTLPNQNF